MSPRPKISPELQRLIDAVKGKRSRIVVDHILKHGHITSQELKDVYGYNHPPRAVRDVREQGVPIDTVMIQGSDGRKIATYKFGNPSEIVEGRLNGRIVIPKEFKQRLCAAHDLRCSICCAPYEERYLQVDHRVPYEVSGDQSVEVRDIADFMPVCGSCNRAKSWSCEHCDNWASAKNPAVCLACYWSNPKSYEHVAGKDERRAVVVWKGEEITFYDEVFEKAESSGFSLDEYLKRPHCGSDSD